MEAHAHLEPGQDCPTCERRIPYPAKATTPKTKVIAERVPVDEADAYRDVAETAARFIGCYGQPYWRFKLNSLAYARLLQDESLKGFANRGPS